MSLVECSPSMSEQHSDAKTRTLPAFAGRALLMKPLNANAFKNALKVSGRLRDRAACLFRIHPGLFELEASLFKFMT